MIFLLVIFLIGALTVSTVDISEDSYIAKKYAYELVRNQEMVLLEKTVSSIISDIFKKDDQNIDALDEEWAKPYFFPTKLGDITVEIVDQERYLNPNTLIDSSGKVVDAAYMRFYRLFERFKIDKEVLDNLVDWIDNASSSNQSGDIPIKNAPLESQEELRYVKGVDDKVYFGDIDKGGFVPGFRTFLSPLSNGKININTASKYALLGLDEKMDETLADKIIEYRKDKRFKSVDDLINVNGITLDMIFRIRQIADVKSEHFLILIKIENGDKVSKISLFYKRDGGNFKKLWRKLE